MANATTQINLYNGVKDTIGTPVEFTAMLQQIKDGTYKKRLEDLRQLEPKAYKKAKQTLPCVTFSGTFAAPRAKESLLQHTGLIVFDLDNLTATETLEIKEQLTRDLYTRAAFISPSGKGLKWLIAFDIAPTTASEHEKLWKTYESYFEKTYHLKIDASGKDVSRLCFVSYDPKLYHNPASALFSATTKAEKSTPKPPKPKTETTETEIDFTEIRKFTDNKSTYAPGSRNHYINLFAINCKERGAHQDETIDYCLTNFEDYEDGPGAVAAIVKSVYGNSKFQFAKYSRTSGTHSYQPGKPAQATTGQPVADSPYNTQTVFWYIVTNHKKDGTTEETVKFSYDDAIEFLQNNGFYKYPLPDGRYQFIHITGNIVRIVTELQIKEFMLRFLKTEPEYKQVREMFRRGSKNYCSTNILEGLEYQKPVFQRDTPDTAYVYFQNRYLEVTAKGITPRQYSELQNHIWSRQIIPYQLNYTGYNAETPAVFDLFLHKAVLGDVDYLQPECAHKIKSLMTTIGYLLHAYKHPDLTKAVIAVDKQLRKTGEANGRSGKSLFSKAIGKMLNMVIIDGPNFKWDYEFAFQQCNVDTRLVNFNDVTKNFDFNRMFGIITEEFNFQKKGKDMITIPFEDSPKFYISTNFSLKGDGDSNRGRQQIIEFSDYFNADRTPFKEFGHRFFSNWNAEEWNRFYTYMLTCIQCYLKHGLVDFPIETYHENRLIDTWGIDSVEWADEYFTLNTAHEVKAAFAAWQSAHPEQKFLKQNMFTKRVKQWAEIRGFDLNAHTTNPERRDKRNGIDYWTFTNSAK